MTRAKNRNLSPSKNRGAGPPKTRKLGPLPLERWSLSVVLTRRNDTRVLTREQVSDEDLADTIAEAWLTGCLRKGYPEVSMDELSSRLIPIPGKQLRSWSGYAIEVTPPGGETIRCEFPLSCLHQVAARAAERSVLEGSLQANDLYWYRLEAEARPPRPSAISTPFTIEVKKRSLELLRTPIAPLLACSHEVGTSSPDDMRIFYTESAFARAEQFSRRGADVEPVVETGAVLVGPLCSCPQTGEFFAVVSDVIEVVDAEQTKYSLYYSSQSWTRIQNIARAMQKQPATRSWRILGQSHGHSFLPASGEAPCESCEKREECDRTSVFVSLDDEKWSRAVFSRQPWQLCHIFGFNARKERVHGLFGLKHGGFEKRGFQVIPEFKPEAIVEATVTETATATTNPTATATATATVNATETET